MGPNTYGETGVTGHFSIIPAVFWGYKINTIVLLIFVVPGANIPAFFYNAVLILQSCRYWQMWGKNNEPQIDY